MSRIAIACLAAIAAACAAAVGAAERTQPPVVAPSGVLVLAQPSPPSLPLERSPVDRRRIVEQRLADGTVLAHLDGEGRERTGLLIGPPGGARPVCGLAPDPAAAGPVVDFRRRERGAGDGRR